MTYLVLLVMGWALLYGVWAVARRLLWQRVGGTLALNLILCVLLVMAAGWLVVLFLIADGASA